MTRLQELLSFSVQQGASDLHLSAGAAPMVRVDGDLTPMNVSELSHDDVLALLYSVMKSDQREKFVADLESDFSFEIPGLSRFRVNAFHQQRGAAAVFRVISNHILSLDELQSPAVFRTFLEADHGLVLVTGPTGSGKTTTLAAMLHEINQTQQKHIVTIEDPVEFVHNNKRCLINQREIGRDTHGFAQALRSALREDPDVILLGEMRDIETIRLALTAAETGHLVFGTLHTNSAAQAINRVIDVFPGNEKSMVRSMLSESLFAVVAQTLLKKATGKGRVAVHEIMLCTPAIRNMIREDKAPQIYSAIQTGQTLGMQTMEQSLKKLRDAKLIL